MIFDATEAQVLEMGRLAIMASRPVGMGILHHQPGLTKDQIRFGLANLTGGGLNIDYYLGRMVKLWIKNVGDDRWECSDTISAEYESWIATYPTYRELLQAALAT